MGTQPHAMLPGLAGCLCLRLRRPALHPRVEAPAALISPARLRRPYLTPRAPLSFPLPSPLRQTSNRAPYTLKTSA